MTTTPPDVHPDGRYSIAQAARILDVSRNTIYRRLNDGILKCRYEKHSKRPRLRGCDLLAYWRAEY